MPQQIGSVALSPAEKKSRQRERDRKAGFVEVLVRVHKSRVSDIRKVELEMRTPKSDPVE